MKYFQFNEYGAIYNKFSCSNALVIYVLKALCYCEHLNGGPGRNGIMCEKEGKFIKSSFCDNTQACIGPATKEKAVVGVQSLCTTGKILG